TLHVSTILLTMFDKRTNLSRQVADEGHQHFPTQTLEVSIPRSVRLAEAPSYGQTVLTYDPSSTGALAYRAAAQKMADRAAAASSASRPQHERQPGAAHSTEDVNE